MNNMSFYLLRPEAGTDKPKMVIQLSAENEKKAINKINFLADEADIDLEGYEKPILTEYPSTNWHDDLPEPGTFSTEWLKRFELLGSCGRTWFPVDPAAEKATGSASAEKPASNVVAIPTSPLNTREKFMRLSRDVRVVAVMERGFYVIDQELTEQETSAFSRKAINANDEDSYLADFLRAIQVPQLSSFNAPRFAAFIAGVHRRFERGDNDASFASMRKFVDYLLQNEPAENDPHQFDIRVALLTMGINPALAGSRDVAKAKGLRDIRAEDWRAWQSSLLMVPGIMTLPPGLLYELTIDGIKDFSLIRDNARRRQYIREHFAGHPLLPDYPIEDAKNHDETEQNAQSTDSTLADAALPADAVAQDTADQPHPAESVETQPPVAERAGPFYVRNEAGDVKRANKLKGLEELLAQGYAEIDKEEYLRFKNAPAADGATLRENQDPTTESLRENSDLSTSNGHEEKLAANINDVEIIQSSPGVFMVPESAEPEPAVTTIVAETAPSNEGEKTEVEQTKPEIPAPTHPAIFDFGRYEGVPNNVYHAANGISSSMVKDARISLMYYHGRHVTRTISRETSDALTFGTLVHTMALEPENLENEFARPFSLPEGSLSTAAEMKAVIENYNATLPQTLGSEEIKALLEKYNAGLPKPFTLGSSTEEAGFLYSSLPEEFQRIGEGEKHTGTAMKACIKEYNATLPVPVKTSGSREALLCELEKIAPGKVAEERACPQPFNTSGSKDELAAVVRQIAPEAVFAEELREQWEKDNTGKILIGQQQHNTAVAIREALLAHPSASRLLMHPSRVTETSYFGMDEDTGLEVRVRPDIELEINGTRIAADLKTTSMGRVKQDYLRPRLHREITERDYHVSAAMYSEVAGFDQFFWIFVNKDPGYHWVAVIEASPELLELGSLEYHRTLARILEATETGYWPAPLTEDYTDELNDFDLRRLEMLRPA